MYSKICPYCWEEGSKESSLRKKRVDYLSCSGISALEKIFKKSKECGCNDDEGCITVWACDECGEHFKD